MDFAFCKCSIMPNVARAHFCQQRSSSSRWLSSSFVEAAFASRARPQGGFDLPSGRANSPCRPRRLSRPCPGRAFGRAPAMGSMIAATGGRGRCAGSPGAASPACSSPARLLAGCVWLFLVEQWHDPACSLLLPEISPPTPVWSGTSSSLFRGDPGLPPKDTRFSSCFRCRASCPISDSVGRAGDRNMKQFNLCSRM